MSDPVVQFDNVTKDYPCGLLGRKTLRAVDGVSLNITRGEVVALLGPNRAGKTTLVKLLLALSRPTAGKVWRLGRPADDRSTLARVGYVHENPAFPRYLTAAGLLEYYGALTLLPQPLLQKRVPELLERVGLADRDREPIARFSKGMLQRLALAQALLNDPELPGLDEPSEGLDLCGRQLIRDCVADLKTRGRTVLVVSHVLHEVEGMCDRVVVLRGGKLVYSDALAELVQDPVTRARRPLESALKELYAPVLQP